MSTPQASSPPLLHEVIRAVEAQAQGLLAAGPLAAAFHYWTSGDSFVAQLHESEVQGLCEQLVGADRSLQALGALGFLVALGGDQWPSASDAFGTGIDWLAGRTIPQSALATLVQPVAYTGVLAGLLARQDAGRLLKFSIWFGNLLGKVEPLIETQPGWRREMLELVKLRLDVGDEQALTVRLDSNVKVLYVARGVARSAGGDVDVLGGELIKRLANVTYDDMEAAALDLAAYRYLVGSGRLVNLRAPSVEDVGLLLSRLSAGLRRWTWEDKKTSKTADLQRWAVQNEYHFQNLLCAVLTPVFSDLRDEEWLESVGQKKPRADLAIPSLRLLIEVKYWRAKDSPQHLISEIAEDVGLYFKKESPYSVMLPIIWDQGRRTEEHDLLRQGLSRLRHVVSPIVVPQPGFMTNEALQADAD